VTSTTSPTAKPLAVQIAEAAVIVLFTLKVRFGAPATTVVVGLFTYVTVAGVATRNTAVEVSLVVKP
jgi:hypothetical protein